MATYGINSYGVKNISTGGSIVFSVDSGFDAISSFRVTNTSNSTITCSAYITRASVDYYIGAPNTTVPVGGSIDFVAGNRILLNTNDIVKVAVSSANSADAWVSCMTVM